MTPIASSHVGVLPFKLKLEEHNPAGSHKDRPAKFIANDLRQRGRRSETTRQHVVALSSGNFGSALALHTAGTEIDLTIITDMLSPKELRENLSSYPHVHLEVIDKPDQTGSHMAARLERRDLILQQYPDAVEIDQYCDRRIPLAYQETLFPELDAQLKGNIGAVFVPVGTGGLLNGLLNYKTKKNRSWDIYAVDAYGSRLFWQPAPGIKRCHSGYGNARQTELLRDVIGNPYRYRVVHVRDDHAVGVCHHMWNKDRILLGASGGATVAGIEVVLNQCPHLIPDAGYVVAVIPDSGRNYLSTVYCDDWLIANGLGKLVSARI